MLLKVTKYTWKVLPYSPEIIGRRSGRAVIPSIVSVLTPSDAYAPITSIHSSWCVFPFKHENHLYTSCSYAPPPKRRHHSFSPHAAPRVVSTTNTHLQPGVGFAYPPAEQGMNSPHTPLQEGASSPHGPLQQGAAWCATEVDIDRTVISYEQCQDGWGEAIRVQSAERYNYYNYFYFVFKWVDININLYQTTVINVTSREYTTYTTYIIYI